MSPNWQETLVHKSYFCALAIQLLLFFFGSTQYKRCCTWNGVLEWATLYLFLILWVSPQKSAQWYVRFMIVTKRVSFVEDYDWQVIVKCIPNSWTLVKAVWPAPRLYLLYQNKRHLELCRPFVPRQHCRKYNMIWAYLQCVNNQVDIFQGTVVLNAKLYHEPLKANKKPSSQTLQGMLFGGKACSSVFTITKYVDGETNPCTENP